MRWLNRPEDASKLIATIAVVLLTFATGAYFGVRAAGYTAASHYTVTGLCFSLPQEDLPNHSAAYWVEREGLKNLAHETRVNKRCRLRVNDAPVQADLHEILVDRGLPGLPVSRR